MIKIKFYTYNDSEYNNKKVWHVYGHSLNKPEIQIQKYSTIYIYIYMYLFVCNVSKTFIGVVIGLVSYIHIDLNIYIYS